MDILDRLRAALCADAVLTGQDTRKWQTDWTGDYPSAPMAVVRPRSTHEVSAVLALAHETRTPVVAVGGNTGLTGAAQTKGGLVLSLDRLTDIEIDEAGRTATAGAGCILAKLHGAAEAQRLIFPLTFGARGSATVGGALSTNAGGSNVVRYGNTRDLVLGIEAVMADGRVMNLLSKLHKDNSGLALRHLLVGAEGTLGVITRAVVKLFPAPRAHATAMVAMESLAPALDLLHRVQDASGGAVAAFEFMPEAYIAGHLEIDPAARAPFAERHPVNILIELAATAERDATPGPDGTIPIAALLEVVLGEMLERGAILDAHVAASEAQRREMWARREAAAEIGFRKRPFIDTDVALPLPLVETFLAQVRDGLRTLDPHADDLVVGHLGDGNLHYSVYPTQPDKAHATAIREMIDDVTVSLGGSFSAEHGIGLSKRDSMARLKDPAALEVMRAIKLALDPQNILNPGKLYPDA